MTQLLPALAVRAALVATATAATAFAAVLPVTTSTAAPAAPPARSAAAAPAPVAIAVAPVALSAPAPAAVGTSALSSAMSKIGAPYRWGAAGPNAFDCSGLVKWSFAQAGVELPRTSRAMSGVGTPVSRSDLQPGDLVFFYKPVSHVAIYIGDGQVVHASTRKSPVKVSSLDAMPFTSARRV